MATCKECVHVGVCRYYTNELAKANGIPLKLEEVERLLECDDCENFKDRSRFVELPFKSRSHYYRILSEIDGYVIAIIFQSINAYHDREEAEQALKEREENE